MKFVRYCLSYEWQFAVINSIISGLKDISYLVIIRTISGQQFLGLKVINKGTRQLKIVPHSQMEAMAQMFVAQGRRLRELEVCLQKEKQEKANLEVDFHHLLELLRLREDRAIACG